MAFEEGRGLITSFRYGIRSYDSIDYYFNGKWIPSTPEIRRAMNFSETTNTSGIFCSEYRMVKIMENIIRNKGRFIP